MAKKFRIQNSTLGAAIIVGLLIEYVLPQIKLGGLTWVATLIYLVVAIILLLFK